MTRPFTKREQEWIDRFRSHATGSRAAVVYRGFELGEDVFHVEINRHRIQFGEGGGGGGFCYACQSFDCIDNLTPEEWKAIHGALDA